MKIAFATFVKNERQFIGEALSIRKLFDDAFAIDYGSTDGTREIMQQEMPVFDETWENDHGKARTALVRIARERGANWIFMLDGDERINPALITQEMIRTWCLVGRTSVSFRRINLTPEGYKPSWWPDIQCRGLDLSRRISFVGGPIHAVPMIDGVVFANSKDNLLAQSVAIEHFSLLKPTAEIDLKFLNYRRIIRGCPPLLELPAGHVAGSEFDLSDSQPLL